MPPATPTATTSFTMEVTPQLILVTLIPLAIQFIYFVGFWTSGGHATPGMRGLKMQVVDVGDRRDPLADGRDEAVRRHGVPARAC